LILLFDTALVFRCYPSEGAPRVREIQHDNPRQVLRDFLRSGRETLELMSKDITANVRLLIAERFPREDLRRLVNEITCVCTKVTRLVSSETPADLDGQAQKLNRGVRV
jgi:hypothetical protein